MGGHGGTSLWEVRIIIRKDIKEYLEKVGKTSTSSWKLLENFVIAHKAFWNFYENNCMLRPGFEPGSPARKAGMIGRATPPELALHPFAILFISFSLKKILRYIAKIQLTPKCTRIRPLCTYGFIQINVYRNKRLISWCTDQYFSFWRYPPPPKSTDPPTRFDESTNVPRQWRPFSRLWTIDPKFFSL